MLNVFIYHALVVWTSFSGVSSVKNTPSDQCEWKALVAAVLGSSTVKVYPVSSRLLMWLWCIFCTERNLQPWLQRVWFSGWIERQECFVIGLTMHNQRCVHLSDKLYLRKHVGFWCKMYNLKKQIEIGREDGAFNSFYSLLWFVCFQCFRTQVWKKTARKWK